MDPKRTLSTYLFDGAVLATMGTGAYTVKEKISEFLYTYQSQIDEIAGPFVRFLAQDIAPPAAYFTLVLLTLSTVKAADRFAKGKNILDVLGE